MTVPSQLSISENLLVLKYLIELKKLGLISNQKEDMIFLSLNINGKIYMAQDSDLNMCVENLIKNIIIF